MKAQRKKNMRKKDKKNKKGLNALKTQLFVLQTQKFFERGPVSGLSLVYKSMNLQQSHCNMPGNELRARAPR